MVRSNGIGKRQGSGSNLLQIFLQVVGEEVEEVKGLVYMTCPFYRLLCIIV